MIFVCVRGAGETQGIAYATWQSCGEQRRKQEMKRRRVAIFRDVVEASQRELEASLGGSNGKKGPSGSVLKPSLAEFTAIPAVSPTRTRGWDARCSGSASSTFGSQFRASRSDSHVAGCSVDHSRGGGSRGLKGIRPGKSNHRGR